MIDRGGIADLVNGVAVTSVIAPSQRPEPLQNLALIVWTGQQHLTRGERLSAHKYLTQFAVDALLELLRQHAGLLDNPTADRLDPRRRLEQCAPAVAAEFERALARPLSQVGPALLALAEQRVRPAAPHLNWAAIAEVRRWLADA